MTGTNDKVKEGLFLYEHGVPPYHGGVCHQVTTFIGVSRVIAGPIVVGVVLYSRESCAVDGIDYILFIFVD